MTIKKDVIYVIKGFVMITKMKNNINYIEKLEITVISQENLEGPLMAFVI